MVENLLHFRTMFGVSLGALMLLAFFVVTRSRYSILRKYSLLRERPYGCKKCLVCGGEIRDLCSSHHNHDWCRCVWR